MELTIWQFLILALIAGICGGLAQLITGFTRGGCLVSIGLGFVGALIGMWLSKGLELKPIFSVQVGETHFPVVWSIIGAAIFAAVIAALSPRRRDRS